MHKLDKNAFAEAAMPVSTRSYRCYYFTRWHFRMDSYDVNSYKNAPVWLLGVKVSPETNSHLGISRLYKNIWKRSYKFIRFSHQFTQNSYALTLHCVAIIACFYNSLSSFIVRPVLRNSYQSTLQVQCCTTLLSNTTSEKPYLWSWLCKAIISASLRFEVYSNS